MKEISVGLVGYNFMGRAHSNAYRQVPFFFPELGIKPVLQMLCGRSKGRTEEAAAQMGWAEVTHDFAEMVGRDDISLIDITSPNCDHVPMSIAVAEAGKAVICEKPLATNLADAKTALKAVQDAGVVNMICHNYRRVPAVLLAKKLIDEGRIGRIYHWRANYLQDWLLDPNTPLFWRMQKAVAGSGTLGDLMAHSIDLARFLVGEICCVAADMTTFIKERPLPESFDAGLGGAGGAKMGTVDVDDATLMIARFSNGAIGSFESSRFAGPHNNYNFFEINGSKGSLKFNLEDMNELEFCDLTVGMETEGFTTISVTEGVHPYLGTAGGPRYWPQGHIIGYEHTFINTIADLLEVIATGDRTKMWPTFEDGVKNQAVLDACERAAESRRWAEVEM